MVCGRARGWMGMPTSSRQALLAGTGRARSMSRPKLMRPATRLNLARVSRGSGPARLPWLASTHTISQRAQGSARTHSLRCAAPTQQGMGPMLGGRALCRAPARAQGLTRVVMRTVGRRREPGPPCSPPWAGAGQLGGWQPLT